jgi:hypothetical protein
VKEINVISVSIMVLFALIIASFADQQAFKTVDDDEAWQIEFPEFHTAWIESALHVKVDAGEYSVDENSPTIIDDTRRFLGIVNKALKLFHPSDPELFRRFPFVGLAIHADEFQENFNGLYGRGDSIHLDSPKEGYIDEHGNLIDGFIIANNVPNSCVIYSVLIENRFEIPGIVNQVSLP